MATGLPSGYSSYSLPTMGPQNKQIFDLFSKHFQEGGGDVFKNLLAMAQGKGDAFSQLEMPARRGLESELANIGMQFGLSGNQKSSGFQNAIAGAGSRFAEDLYGKRADLMQRSMNDVLNIGEKLLSTPTQQFGLVAPGQGGMDWKSLLGPAGEAAGGILKNIIGEPSKNAAGEKGTDWGEIASTVAKYLPMLLSLL